MNNKITTSAPRLSPHLIPLQQPEPIESSQISQLRQAKKRIREFEQGQKVLKQLYGQGRHREQLMHKSAHRHCAYHTYDYQANLIKVTQLRLQHMMDKEGNLDTSPPTLNHLLAQHLLLQKVPAVQRTGSPPKPTEHSVQKTQNITTEIEQRGGQKKKGPISIHKPAFRFEKSSVKSLAEGVEGMMSTGVKLVTSEQKVVRRNNDEYHIEESEVVKHKKRNRSQKQKTGSSQSVIYMLGGDLLQSRQSSSQTPPSYEIDPEGRPNRSIQLQLYNNPQNMPVKLPPISPSRHSQPALRGLEQVTISSPSMSRASRHSSGNQDKESVKEYFGGYGRQFRQRRLWERGVK